jgi:hypothetical protein
MLTAVWKVISLFLALGSFLVVGVMTLMIGEELIWVVGKAIVAFVVCWIIFGYLGGMLLVVAEKHTENPGGTNIQ